MIKNILFDLDGTLTDPKTGITRCIRFSLEHSGAALPGADELTWCIGPPLRDSFAKLLDTEDGPTLDRALALYRKRFSEKGMYENHVYPQIPPCLEQIRAAGLKLLLATSKPRVFAEKILEHFGLAHFFTGIYGAGLDGSLVDKGELIAHILASESLDPGETLMVGDRIYDILGGKKNGVATAAVTYGYGSADEIQSAHPDMVFDRPADLAEALTRPSAQSQPAAHPNHQQP
ncbi:MAG: HAD family hydrolase [Desulfobacter sp.]|nr:MAG: HAD family hydrolase [Desulfobacter sp.]